MIPAVLGGKSVPLDYGAKRRFASAAQRQALMLRSATCEFAGCTVSNYGCRAHHLSWWTDTHNSGYELVEAYRPDGWRLVASRDQASSNTAPHHQPRPPLPSYGPPGFAAAHAMPVS